MKISIYEVMGSCVSYQLIDSKLEELRKVAIIDDMVLNIHLLFSYFDGNILTHLDCFDSGLGFVKRMRESSNINEYNLIIMDYSMPKMNGLEASKQLRKLGYIGRIVIITGHRNRKSVRNIKKYGVNDIFYKPIQKHEILEYIQTNYVITPHSPESDR